MKDSSDTLERMVALAERLKLKASATGAAIIETKLTDSIRLNDFLVEEMATYSSFLQGLIGKWEALQNRMEDLTSWMETTEKRLNSLESDENVSIEWLTDVKVCL